MSDERHPPIVDDPIEPELELTLAELCRVCQMSAEQMLELIDAGIVEPLGRDRHFAWRFESISVRRIRGAQHLRRDLGVNWAGAALALELLDELRLLRARLSRYED